MFLKFNVESRFQQYCTIAGVNLDTCPTAQVIEMRRTYYAACGALLLFLKNDLTQLPDDDGADELERILNSVEAFFKRQSNQPSPEVKNGL